MKFTKADYEERKARIDAGEGSDEDRRLVKQYEQQKPSGGPASDTAAHDAAAEETPEPATKTSGTKSRATKAQGAAGGTGKQD